MPGVERRDPAYRQSAAFKSLSGAPSSEVPFTPGPSMTATVASHIGAPVLASVTVIVGGITTIDPHVGFSVDDEHAAGVLSATLTSNNSIRRINSSVSLNHRAR